MTRGGRGRMTRGSVSALPRGKQNKSREKRMRPRATARGPKFFDSVVGRCHRHISTFTHPLGSLPARRHLIAALTSKSFFRPYHIVVHWSFPPLIGRSPSVECGHIVVPPDMNFFGSLDVPPRPPCGLRVFPPAQSFMKDIHKFCYFLSLSDFIVP